MPNVKEIRILSRLRAQILLGRTYMRAKVRGRVPGPPRIEEDCARQRDHCGIPGGDDGLRLLELGDQSNRDPSVRLTRAKSLCAH